MAEVTAAKSPSLLPGRHRGNPDDLRAWQKRMGFTFEQAIAALDMSGSAYAQMLKGASRIDKRTALACAAIEHGLWPIDSGN